MNQLCSSSVCSPLQATLERATASFEYLSVGFGQQPDGWLRSSDIVNDPDAVQNLLDEVCHLFQMDNRQVAASFLVMGYSWHLMTGAVACLLLDQRVPDLSADAVALDLRGGAMFLSPHVWALPDDPDADHPDVTVVADRQELRVSMIRQLEEGHATPLFATLRSVAPFGVNGMRANYVDRLASAILWLTEQMEDTELARQEIPAMVELASRKARTGLLEVEHNGETGVFLRRGGCCLNYRLPDREKCDTCCLRPLDERVSLLRQHLADNAH